MKKLIAFAIVFALFGVSYVGNAQDVPIVTSPVECTLDTTNVTAPTIIPRVDIVGNYETGDTTPVVLMTLSDVPNGQEINLDIPVTRLGVLEILPLAYDATGQLSVPPVPVSTVRVQVYQGVVGSCGLRLR